MLLVPKKSINSSRFFNFSVSWRTFLHKVRLLDLISIAAPCEDPRLHAPPNMFSIFALVFFIQLHAAVLQLETTPHERRCHYCRQTTIRYDHHRANEEISPSLHNHSQNTTCHFHNLYVRTTSTTLGP